MVSSLGSNEVFGEMAMILKSNQQYTCFWGDLEIWGGGNLGRWKYGEVAIWGGGNLGRWQFGEMGIYQ